MSEVPASFYLADWHVDTSTNRLRRGETEVKLDPRAMAVLHHLARHAGELVTREDLERSVWRGSVVGYDALTGCIAKLRKALEDDPRRPRYIETISKKGYRLIGEISGEGARSDDRQLNPVTGGARRRRLLWGAVIGGMILALLLAGLLGNPQRDEPAAVKSRPTDRPAIVVLPFRNASDVPGQDYFSEGITADITTALSKLSGLFVIAPSSASGYRGRPLDLQRIAESLGVRYVVQGSVRRSGEQLRVNVHLVDAATDVYLWSEKYDRRLRNVFDVQDDITSNVVKALSVRLTEEERRRTARRYTTSIDAYDDFLRGQALYVRHTRDDNLRAREYYRQAIDRDAGFARAYSAIALTYVAEQRYGWADASRESLEKALELARKGVALDDELPQAYWVLGYVHTFRQEYAEAARAANRALELDPNFADSYLTLAVSKLYFGKPEEALRLVQKAMLLNPRYPAAYASVLGQIHYFTGDYERALPALREAVERNISLRTPHVFLIAALSKLQRMEEAGWAVEQLKAIAPDLRAANVAEMLPIQDAALVEAMQRHLERAGL